MEKIRKKKAVFRVEFNIYSNTDLAHDQMCQQIELMLRTLKEIYDNETYTIAMVIPTKVKRVAR